MSARGRSAEVVGDNGEAGVADGGPGLAYMSFVVMEDLLDKLKLLNYEEEFVRELRMRPLNRHYFVLQTNPGEQVSIFTMTGSRKLDCFTIENTFSTFLKRSRFLVLSQT